MLRSMFSGVSGLRNHQIKMDVIGNNIANVNTQGYKTSRTTFAEMFNQTLAGATRPSENLGGINPKQIGLGVSTSSIDVVHTTGGMMTTDRMLDLAIQGDGFITVRNGDDTYYTRAGNLYLDENGYLLNANGMFVQGVMFIDVDAANEMTADDVVDYEPDPTDRDAYIDPATGIVAGFGTDDDDALVSPLRVPMNFVSISIDTTGMISGMAPNGDLVTIGMIPLACMVNPAGLTRISDNLYQESSNSGNPTWYQAGQGGIAGDLRAGALEMSNVDLSKEFTDMIITQRGFQANSRIITVSDTLLEELINLKR